MPHLSPLSRPSRLKLLTCSVLLWLALSACGSKCPKCPEPLPPLPPKVVTVTEKCMGPIPDLPLRAETIPDALDDATLTALLQSFLILANYVAVEHTRCGK